MTEVGFDAILGFLMQTLAAVTGAASLWGFVLWAKGERELAQKLFPVFISAVSLFSISWLFSYLFVFLPQVVAHEGIILKPKESGIIHGFALNLPFVIVLILISVIGIWLKTHKNLFKKYIGLFFLSCFLLISFILLFKVTANEAHINQIFFSLHNWHSILTLGTIIAIDTLYLSTIKQAHLKRVLYPFFPFMSAAIWIGLAIDFVSVFLIIDRAFYVTGQFLFNQTVIGIIILNGTMLSGRVNEKLISLIRQDRVDYLPAKVNLLFEILGSISIVSWLTITFLDFVIIPFSYMQFFSIYIISILIAFFLGLSIRRIVLAKNVI